MFHFISVKFGTLRMLLTRLRGVVTRSGRLTQQAASSTPKFWSNTSIVLAHSSIRRARLSTVTDPKLSEILNAERVSEEVDVCIVGAGPAGLSAAIKIRQLSLKEGKDIRVFVVEKGSEVGTSSCILPLERKETSYLFCYIHVLMILEKK
jgi:hypothetical protein